jgi:uncharacterized protein YkwD
MHAMRCKKVAVALVATITLGLAVSSCGFANVSSTGPSDGYTVGLYHALNADRAANGLPALAWSPKLANQAGTWAYQMAQEGVLHHQDLNALIYSDDYAAFWSLGENILVGPVSMTPDSMERAWMASPPHRANIMSPNYNVVGIGYWRGSDGRVWAVQDFGGI